MHDVEHTVVYIRTRWMIVLLMTFLCGFSAAHVSRAQDAMADSSGLQKGNAIKIKPARMDLLRKSPTGALVRSVVFPGWGQFYTKHYIKGGIIMCLEAGLIISALIEDQRAQDVYLTDYDGYLESIDRRNQYIWWTAGVVVYSMIDAYVDAHLFKFDEDDMNIDIEPSQDMDGIRFSFRVSLSVFR